MSDLEVDSNDLWNKLPIDARPLVLFEEIDCESGGPSGINVYRDSKGKVLYTKKSPKKGIKFDACCDLMRNENSEHGSREKFRQFEIAYLIKKYKNDEGLFDIMNEWLSCL